MEFTEENFKALQAENTDLKGKLKSANDEAKGHRLSAESFRTQADEFRTKYTESASKIDDMTKAHAKELDDLKLDHGAKIAASENAGKATQEAADKRVMMAELKVVASAKGILDHDYLKLLDTSKVKMDADGNVTNADEVLEEFKVSKPHMFGDGKKPGVETGTTTSAKPAPKADASTQKFDAMTASPEEFAKAVKSLGHRK